MAGYAKIWTDIFNDGWFLSLSLTARGLWLQLIVDAKMVGDTGVVTGRSWASFGSLWGCDGKTAKKILVSFLDSGKVHGKFLENYIEIEIVNYKYWQGLTKNQINPESRPIKENAGKIPSKPDQTRAEQSKPVVEPPKVGPTTPAKIPNPGHKEFVKFYCDEYQSRFNVKYDFNGGRDGALIKGLLKTFGIDLLKKITLEFFQTDDQFIKEKTGFTVPALKMRANQIAANLSRNKTFMDKLSPAGKPLKMPPPGWRERKE
jgi:hypothetical protein